MKIRTRINIATFGVIITIMVVVGLLFIRQASSVLEEKTLEKNSLLSKSYAQGINSQLGSYKKSIEKFSSAIVTAIYIPDVLREEKRLYPEFLYHFYLSKDGYVLNSYPALDDKKDVDFSKTGFWKKAQKKKSPVISGVTTRFGKPSIVFAMPVYSYYYDDPDPELLGMAGSVLPLSMVFRQLEGVLLGSDSYIFIVNDDGKLLFKSDNDNAVVNINQKLQIDNKKILASMDGSHEGRGLFTSSGVDKFVSFYPFTETGWTLGIIGNVADLHKERNDFIVIFVFALIIGTFVAYIISRVLSNSIIRPMRNVIDSLKNIAEGKAPVDNVAKFEAEDEIGSLSHYFNTIVTDLRTIARELDVDLKNEKKALLETRNRFRAIFNQTMQFTMLLDRQGCIMEINQSLLKFTGIFQDEIIGTSVLDAPWWIEDEASREFLAKHIDVEQQGEITRFEMKVKGKLGQIIVCDFSMKPVYDSNNEINLIICEGNDVTTRKNVEKQLAVHKEKLEGILEERTIQLKEMEKELFDREKLATLGHLNAIVSHELRNPLATIRNSVSMLKKYIDNGSQRIQNVFDRIDRNIQRCVQIIEELLDFTRNKYIKPQEIDLSRWLDTVLDEFHMENTFSIKNEIERNIKITIDPEKMRRVFINIFTNAMQAIAGSDQDSGAITIHCVETRDDVDVHIIDNGPGIPDEVLSKVFEPLFSTKSYGIGLGLVVAKQIMEVHNGNIRVENIQDRGAHVILTIPRTYDRMS